MPIQGMRLPDNISRLLAFVFVTSEIVALMGSPSCRIGFHLDQALVELALVGSITIISMFALTLKLGGGGQAAIPVEKESRLRVVPQLLLCVGIAGCLLSLGCARLEALWPSLPRNNLEVLLTSASAWKDWGLCLMLLGLTGLTMANLRPVSPNAKAEP